MKTTQWNCNGFFRHIEYLQKLNDEENPTVICIQETHLKTEQNVKLKDFNIFRRDRLGALKFRV